MKSNQPAARMDERTRDLVLQTDVANVLKKVKAGKPMTAAERRLIESQEGTPKKSEPEAESNDLDGPITAEQLCSWTGLTDRRHRQIAAKGYFPPPILGRYQAGKTLIGMVKYMAEMVRKKDGKQAKEQLKLTKAKRELAQEELSEVRGKYVEKAAIGPALRNISLHQRATLQRKLEQELGPNLAGLTTVEILAKIKPTVDEVCQIFRERVGGWMDSPPEPITKPE